jgi:tetratricopeptide (TPR) repeat protein
MLMNLCVERLVIIFGLLGVLPLAGQAAHQSVEHYSEVGNRALAEGRYADAEQAFEKLRELAPEMAEVHANLGLIYFEERKFPDAVRELQRALKLKPALTKSSTILAMSLAELGRYKEALPGLEKGFRSSDRETKRMCGLQLERAHTGLQQDAKALEVAMEMSRSYPYDPEVLYHSGKIFGNYAFLSMQKLAEVAPDSIWTHQAAAEAYESQGSFDSAIGEYRHVLAIEPLRPGVHYRLGRTLLARWRAHSSPEDLSSAAKEFAEELSLDPLNANSAYELGEIHRDAGEFSDAEKYFKLALENYPNFEQAHLGLAAALTSVQKVDQALAHLKKAIALNPENEVSWYRLAQVERMLGDRAEKEKALAEFQRLHSKKTTTDREPGKNFFSSDEVTKQALEDDAPK